MGNTNTNLISFPTPIDRGTEHTYNSSIFNIKEMNKIRKPFAEALLKLNNSELNKNGKIDQCTSVNIFGLHGTYIHQIRKEITNAGWTLLDRKQNDQDIIHGVRDLIICRPH